MQARFPSTSRLAEAAGDLFDHLLLLEKSEELRRSALDARSRIDDALDSLGPTLFVNVRREPRAVFDVMSDEQQMLVHDAYIAVLSLAQSLQHPEPDPMIDSSTFEDAAISIAAMLDELIPFVSLADDALRRVLLHGEPLEVAVARIANAR